MTDYKKLPIGGSYSIGPRGIYGICKALTDAHGKGSAETFQAEFSKWAVLPTQEPPIIHVVGAVMFEGDSCFAARRAAHKADAGLWEFPGGKIEEGERPEDALARELREEFGIEVEVGERVARGIGEAECAIIELDLYWVRWVSGDIVFTDHDASGWFGAQGLECLKWAAADRAVLPQVLIALRQRGGRP